MTEKNKISDVNNMIIFYDEFNIDKVKNLLCLDDKTLLLFTNHTKYNKSENQSYINKLKSSLKYLIYDNINNKIKRNYIQKGCNRLYCIGYGMQYFSNRILNYILPNNSCEYDIINCSPSILLYLYKKHNLSHIHLESYCKNRSDLLKSSNLTKIDINTFMNKDNYNNQNIEWLDLLINEVNNNKEKLFKLEYDKINQKYQEEKKLKKNYLSSMCCSIIFYYENLILQKAINTYKCIVPKYDGFLSDEDINICDLNKLSEEYGIKWAKKYTEKEIIIDEWNQSKLDKILSYKFNVLPKHTNTSLDLANKIYKELNNDLIFCNNSWICYNKTNRLWITIKNPNYIIHTYINQELNKYWTYKLSKQQEIIAEENETYPDNENAGAILWAKIEKEYNKAKKDIDKSSFMSSLIKHLEYLLLDNDFINKLDIKPYQLVFKNGIYDIKSKKLNDIHKSDYITKTINHDYNKNINLENRNWIKSELLKICNMNEDHLEYYLSIIGFCILGVPEKEQEIYCLIGQSASNGKTILLETLLNIFDIYIGKSDSKVFESDCNKKHKYLSNFINNTYRIIICNEFDDKKKIDSKTFKDVADGLTLDNEVLFGTTQIKKITGKPFIISNYSLKFDKDDSGMSRRYKHVQFNSKFYEDYELEEEDIDNLQFYKDKNFLNKLLEKKNELIDIIIEYANKYIINQKLPDIPEEFKSEQNDILSMNNEFQTWFENLEKEINDNEMCKSIDLFNKYNDYAKDNGFEALSKQRNVVDKIKSFTKYKYDRTKMIDGKKGVFIGFSLINSELNNQELINSDTDDD